jgi:hypothetical protein
MSQYTAFHLRLITIVFVLFWHFILPQNVNAQSIYMMKYLPRDPSLHEELKAPKGIRRWVNLMDEIWKNTVNTDTLNIKTYDDQGRIAEYISFSSSGKEDLHLFREYPGAQIERSYTIMKMANNIIVRNYDETVIDSIGNFIDACSYQVTNKGDTIIVNDHDYVYDNRGRLIYQCDLCNQGSPIKRYFRYNNHNLTRLCETRFDTTETFDVSDMTYNQDGMLTRYTYRHIFKGDTTLRQDRLYAYADGRLVREMQFNDFEEVWREFIYHYDAQGHIIKSYQIIETDTTSTTYYFTGDKLMRSFLSTSFQYDSGYVYFGNQFRESFDGKDHTTETRYTYDKDGNRITTEQYWDGLLRIRYRSVFE